MSTPNSGAPASASDAAKTPGVLWSAWPEDDCDSDPHIDPMAQKVTEWFVGRWPIGTDEPECRILIGAGRSAEIVARRIAKKLTSILNTDAIKAAALAPPAVVPESVRRELPLLEIQPIADRLHARLERHSWSSLVPGGDYGLPGTQQHWLLMAQAAIEIVKGALSAPSGRADAPPAGGGAVPEGWRLVPERLMQEMRYAMSDAQLAHERRPWKESEVARSGPEVEMWAAALAAAPEPAAGRGREIDAAATQAFRDLDEHLSRKLSDLGGEDAFPNFGEYEIGLPAGHWRLISKHLRSILSAPTEAGGPVGGGWRWTARDGLPTYDAEFGERWLLTWSEASATYDIGCINGQWSHGETIDMTGTDAWKWLEFSPGAPPTPADASAEGGQA